MYKFIAGEDLRAGDMLSYGKDGRLYSANPADRGSLKSLVCIAGRNYKKGEAIHPIVDGTFTIQRSYVYRLTRWLRRLSYRIRGRIYPYID